MSKKLSALPVGAKVRDPQSVYNGIPIDGIILGHNHDGSGITSFLSEKIITLKCFDAKEASNSDSNRRSYGNNRYKLSNLLQWLNSEGKAGNWYVAQHSADAPPTNGNVWSNYNEYDQEAGFLANLSNGMKAALISVTKTVAKNTVTDGGGSETVNAKIHLLSRTEVGLSTENGIEEGKIYDYFSQSNNNARRVAYPTQPCVNKSEYTNSSLKTSSGWYYWLRTPSAARSGYARAVGTDGSLDSGGAYSGGGGVRPAWFLSSDILVSDSPNSEGYYEIQWNAAPTITTNPAASDLGNISAAFDLKFTVADADGDACSANVKIDSETIANYDSATLGTQYTISISSARLAALSTGKHTIYITATDSAGNTTQAVKTFNRVRMAPVISVPSTNIGNQNKHFTIAFTVTDADSSTASAVAKFDNADTIATFDPVILGAENTISISSAQLAALSLGAHTIDIIATDPDGLTGSVSITFNRIVTAPVIATEENDIGEQNKAFTIEFTVTDEDSDTCAAVVKIDNSITIATFDPVVLGHKTTATVTNSQLVALSVGAHTIDIIATDPDDNTDTAQIAFARAASTVIISGEDTDLGQVWKKPSIVYQVHDTANQTVTKITETINDTVVKAEENPPVNTDIAFDLTSWADLPEEAAYICKVEAENAIGMTAERTYTLRKLYDRLIVESEIQTTDAAAFNVVVNAIYEAGSGGIVIEACNNAHDNAPEWEDITSEFLAGSAHAFTNKEKTAERWGVQIRITILKGDTERVYLNGYSFSYN